MKILLKANADKAIQQLISDMLDILNCLGCTDGLTDRRLERMAKACLAVGGVKERLEEAKSVEDNFFLGTREIISYENSHFGEHLSAGSYDDIRRKDLQAPIDAGLVISSSALEKQATNSPNRKYALTPLFASLIRQYRKPGWGTALQMFNDTYKFQNKIIDKKNKLEEIDITLPSGEKLELSPGGHNELQKDIIEKFLSRFGMNAQVLYIGDTSKKLLYEREDILKAINFFSLGHEMLPDIVAYSQANNIVFLIEAVYSSGAMSETRVSKLKESLKLCKCEPIFVTAFPNKKLFQRFASEIAWESEVWIADTPEHMIHFNGSKFLKVHSSQNKK